jgi:hypothetical protein
MPSPSDVVLEDWDLVGAELNWHGLRCPGMRRVGKGEMFTASVRGLLRPRNAIRPYRIGVISAA